MLRKSIKSWKIDVGYFKIMQIATATLGNKSPVIGRGTLC